MLYMQMWVCTSMIAFWRASEATAVQGLRARVMTDISTMSALFIASSIYNAS